MNEYLRIFKALGNGTRLNIITFLLDGEKCVCEIVPRTKRKQSAVSIQLGKLEKWGILESRREGRQIFYRIKDRRVFDILTVSGLAKAGFR
jgi:DNA-binding transcriptional ArsR family regulator